MYVLINIMIFLVLMFCLYVMKKKHIDFTFRVLSALIMGLALGFLLRSLYASNTEVINKTIVWYNVVGNGYVRLLQMLVMPLIFVSITMALINIKGESNLKKMTLSIIAVLMITTAISALVGILVSKGFGLDASKLQSLVGDASGFNYEDRLKSFAGKSAPQQLLEIIPTNPFSALAGGGGGIAYFIGSILFGIDWNFGFRFEKEKTGYF